MQVDRQADYEGAVFRLPDYTVVVGFPWDHYANPTGPHHVTQEIAPDWLLLLPGQRLQLNVRCQGFGVYNDHEGHATVVIWFTTTRP